MTINASELVSLQVQQAGINRLELTHRKFIAFVEFEEIYNNNSLVLNQGNWESEKLNVAAAYRNFVEIWFNNGGLNIELWRAPVDFIPEPTVDDVLTPVDFLVDGDLGALEGLALLPDLVDGDPVLVINQTDPINNGLYLANANAWTRAPEVVDNGSYKINYTAADVDYYILVNGVVGTDPINIQTLAQIQQPFTDYTNEFLVNERPRQLILGAGDRVISEQLDIYNILSSLYYARNDQQPNYYYLSLRSLQDVSLVTSVIGEGGSRFVSMIYDQQIQDLWAAYFVGLDFFNVYKNADFETFTGSGLVGENINNFNFYCKELNVGVLDNVESLDGLRFVNMVDSQGVDITANFVREDIAYSIRSNVLNTLALKENDGSAYVNKTRNGIAIIAEVMRNSFEFLRTNDTDARIDFATVEVVSPTLSSQNEPKTLKDFIVNYDYIQQINRIKGVVNESISNLSL